MKKKPTYFRIGTTYYKMSLKPDLKGNTSETLIPWNKDTLNSDETKEFIASIRKFDAFVCIPDHLNYNKYIGDFYNLYHPLPIGICNEDLEISEIFAKISNTINFLDHIFGEQLEIGLDYLKIILEKPTQILPILSLVSTERSTGKSSFLKFLHILFGSNLTFVNANSFSSQFNSDTVGKVLVVADEAFLDQKVMTERLKFLSTTTRDKLEKKGSDRIEVDSFSKYVLCSNNENSFVLIDNEEIRFWVRKINTIKSEDVNLLEKLKSEATYFLKFLLTRPYYTKCSTRMWFTADQIRTKALDKLMKRNNNKLEAKLVEALYEFFDEVEEETICGTAQDFLNIINRLFKGMYFTRNDVRKILKDSWRLDPQNNGFSYVRYDIDHNGTFFKANAVGRYFKIEKGLISSKFVEFVEE